jgi:hypothetical protein
MDEDSLLCLFGFSWPLRYWRLPGIPTKKSSCISHSLGLEIRGESSLFCWSTRERDENENHDLWLETGRSRGVMNYSNFPSLIIASRMLIPAGNQP